MQFTREKTYVGKFTDRLASFLPNKSLSIASTLVIVLGATVTLSLVLHQTNFFQHASGLDSARFEASSANLSGPVIVVDDPSASSGKALVFGATANSTPTLTVPVVSSTPTSPPVSGKVGWSSGFYPAWQQGAYPPSTLPWQGITQLNHFSMLTGSNRDGSLNTTAHGLTPTFMQQAVAAAHQHNKKIFIAIGGAEDNNWDAACNATNRSVFITNIVNIVQQYGYDGVDLDIEQDFGSPAHTDYIACVSGIRTALNNLSPKRGLTADGDPDWQAYMLAQVWQYLDQINLMSYGATASTIQTGINNYTSSGIPARLLSIGIGLEPGEADVNNVQDCTDKAQYAVGNGSYNTSHTVYGGVMQWTIPDDAADHNGQYLCLNAVANYVQ